MIARDSLFGNNPAIKAAQSAFANSKATFGEIDLGGAAQMAKRSQSVFDGIGKALESNFSAMGKQ